MPRERSARLINISPLDDLFEPTVEHEGVEQRVTENRVNNNYSNSERDNASFNDSIHRETLPTTLSLARLKPFPEHPFKVREDEDMTKLVESIRENGVLEPILCRPDGNGDYQIISGHRRLAASKLAGLDEVPVTVRNMDDITATLCMVDANLHRESILPSEKAFAFKLKLNALEERRRLGLIVSEGRRATEIVGETTGDNYRNVMRYIRLTELTPHLLMLVDSGKLKFHPAVELSYLTKDEQDIVYMAIWDSDKYPSITQARALKQLSQTHSLNEVAALNILCGDRIQPKSITFKADELAGLFPRSYTSEQIKEEILDILEARQRNRAREER